MTLIDSLAAGSVITVETAIFPTIRVDLSEELNAPQGALTKIARPRITLWKSGTRVLVKEPAGSPDAAPPYKLILLGLALVVLLALLAKGK